MTRKKKFLYVFDLENIIYLGIYFFFWLQMPKVFPICAWKSCEADEYVFEVQECGAL